MSESQTLNHGMWVFPDGDYSFLDEEKNKANQPDTLPYKALSRLITYVSEDEGDEKGLDVRELRRWVRMNPPPSGKGEDMLIQWLQQLAVRAIYKGLTLMWRGGIVTSVKDLDELKTQIRQTRTLERLQWPEDAILTLTTLCEKTGSKDTTLSMKELIQG